MDLATLLLIGGPVYALAVFAWAAGAYYDRRLDRIERAQAECLARTGHLQTMTGVLIRRRERQRAQDAALDVFRLTDEQADAALAAYRGPDEPVPLTPAPAEPAAG